MSYTVDLILEEIKILKKEKPKGWRRMVHSLCIKLDKLKDPYADCEYIGTEKLNRERGVRVVPF